MLLLWSDIIYVYFIYSRNRLIYIGRSKHPLKRVHEHRRAYRVGDTDFKMVVYGPYEKWHGYLVEAYEITKRLRSKYFKSQINSNHGYSEKISVKDSGQKVVFYFGKGGEIKKVVS